MSPAHPPFPPPGPSEVTFLRQQPHLCGYSHRMTPSSPRGTRSWNPGVGFLGCPLLGEGALGALAAPPNDPVKNTRHKLDGVNNAFSPQVMTSRHESYMHFINEVPCQCVRSCPRVPSLPSAAMFKAGSGFRFYKMCHPRHRCLCLRDCMD